MKYTRPMQKLDYYRILRYNIFSVLINSTIRRESYEDLDKRKKNKNREDL